MICQTGILFRSPTICVQCTVFSIFIQMRNRMSQSKEHEFENNFSASRADKVELFISSDKNDSFRV